MSDVTFRPFTWSDVPALTEIYRHYVDETVITFETEAPGEAAMAERFGKLLDLGHPLIIAECGGRAIGYAYASFYRPRAAYRFTCEDSIYLAKDAVGKGIGGRLLDELMAQCRVAGFKQMIAVITAERANSVRLHEKAGFRHVGRYEAVGYKFDRWLDIVHLQKAL
ncbi:GNAT family N-acetyltransferase [Devosia sp. ZB163]|uniref:GNAT family N-acetyltransferase n=1 Tax=Devosia sp. ZB163 TaxID=3025938 RepID=UPI00235FC412|nr:GNAT family N-acetyltransferase [Devosia sp. ZB163]MDC9822356.1 GNAT family N-acetyltransferase [Devosia sp. ZB163]